MDPDVPLNADAESPVHPQALGVIDAFLDAVIVQEQHEYLDRRDNIAMPHGPHGDSLDPSIG